MSLIGKYIKQTWINGNYRSIWLRRIDRETSSQYISNSQRYFRNFEDGVDDRTFHSEWATRFRKNPSGDKTPFPTYTKRSNPDGHFELQIVNDFNKDLLCEYTFNELFKTDLRELQDADSTPRNNIDRAHVRAKNKKYNIWNTYILENYLHEEKEALDNKHWNAPLIKFLRNTFNIPVYTLMEKVSEFRTQGKLYKSITCMHVTYFNNDRKIISFDENFHNRTIGFWLFKDKLVFQYEDGKDTF